MKALSLVFLLSTCTILSVNHRKNYIKNYDFEDSIDRQWYLVAAPGVSVIRDSNVAFSGKYSLRIENPKPENRDYYGCNQRIAGLSIETKLNLEAAIKTSDLLGEAGIDVHFRDSSGVRMPIYDAKILIKASGASHNWETYSINFTVPQGTKELIVAIFLKGHGKIWVDNVILKSATSNDISKKNPSAGAFVLREKNPMIWFEFAEQKVYYDTPPPLSTTREKIEIAGARNEWEPFQIVLKPKRMLPHCSIEFTDLESKDGFVIKKDRIIYYVVGFVDIDSISTPSGVSGPNPDFLQPADYFDLSANRNNPIWINVMIPENARQGVYNGSILLRLTNDNIIKIPLEITVWNFTIPTENHIYVQSSFRLSLIKKYDKRDDMDILTDYYGNLRHHRVNVYCSVEIETQVTNNELVCSFSKFDKIVKMLLDEYKFEAVITGPFVGDASGWENRRKWMGIDPGSPIFKQLLKQYCIILSSHLKENGWLSRCWIQYWDEPPLDDPNFSKIVEIGRIFKEFAPSLKIFMTTSPVPQLYGITDIWCVPFDRQRFDPQIIADRKSHGEKIFVYHNDPYIDTPLIDKRLFAWRYQLAKIDGVYAWWNVAFWPSDPYTNPHMAEEKGGKVYHLKPGDGSLLYPNPIGAGPPINSMRWEIYRQGLEDYEYYKILEEKIACALLHLKTTESFSDYAEYLIERATSRMTTDYFYTRTRDAAVLHEIRRGIAEEILSIDQPPTLLAKVSTENIKTAKTAKVSGITEYGAKVYINNKSVSVKDDGSFSSEVAIVGEDYIRIRAELGTSIKTIKRYVE